MRPGKYITEACGEGVVKFQLDPSPTCWDLKVSKGKAACTRARLKKHEDRRVCRRSSRGSLGFRGGRAKGGQRQAILKPET